MGTLATSTFTRYTQSEEELMTGAILTESQFQKTQSQLCDIAEQKLNLTFDPLNPIKFAQDEAFLSGQLSILRLQIEEHQVALSLMQAKSQEH